MTQKTDPFIQLNWDWDTGEGGWGEGMNQNLIIHAFLQNKRINNILASASLLPSMPVDGDVYFAEADETLYLRAEGSWYTFQPTVGMTFILKTTEAVVKYNGTTLVSDTKSISEVVGLQSALDAKVSSSLVGANSGVAPLGVDGKVPAGYLPASGSYLGTWNATTNTPTITSGVGSSGEFYKVSVGGSVTIDGVSSWSIGDEVRFNGTVWQRVPNTSAVSSVNGYTGAVVLNASDVGAAPTSHTHPNATTTVSGFMSDTDKVKLNGIATGATLNSPDATLLARANHTGTQAQSTITNLTTDLAAKQATLVNTVNIKSVNGVSLLGAGDVTISAGGSTTFTGLTDTPASYTGQALKATRVNAGETALEFVSLGSAAYNNSGDFATSSHTHPNATTTVSGFMSDVDKTKLNSVATGATANSSDATLLARANHTGTQTSSTISDFNSAVDARVASGITGKEGTIVATTASDYYRGDKTFQPLNKAAVGLSNVDNTSDATKNSATAALTNKTISGASNTLSNIAQSSVTGLVTDLSLKAPLASPTFTGTVTLPVTTSIGSVGGTEISYLAGVSSGIQAQLNGKQASLGYTPANKAGDTFTGNTTIGNGSGQKILYVDGGSSGTAAGGAVYFSASGVTNAAVGHLSSIIGGSYNPNLCVYSGSGDVNLFSYGASRLTIGASSISSNLDFSAPSFYGSGANLTSLNASNLSSGTINLARLPFVIDDDATSNSVVQRDSNGDIYAHAVFADEILGDFYGNGASLTNLTASNIAFGTVPDARLSSNVALVSNTISKATPAQLFQSLGTVNGAVTINGANGLHVLATVNGNTTWTFPTPSATEAMALTLELTNGGAHTMTWPSGTRWAGGVAPTLTASGTDILVFTKAGTNNWRGYLSSKDNK